MTFLEKLMKNLALHFKLTCFPSLLYTSIKGRNLKYIGHNLPYTGTPMLRNNVFKSVGKTSITFTLFTSARFTSGIQFSKQDSTLNRNRELYFAEKSHNELNKLGLLYLSLRIPLGVSPKFNYVKYNNTECIHMHTYTHLDNFITEMNNIGINFLVIQISYCDEGWKSTWGRLFETCFLIWLCIWVGLAN